VSGLVGWLEANGLVTADDHKWFMIGIAAALAVGGLLLGQAVGRLIASRVATIWSERLGAHAEGLGARLPRLLRHLGALIVLAIVLAAWPWRPLAASPLGLLLGISGALATVQLLRGLRLPRWIAWLIAAIAFVALFSHAVGGLRPITHILEEIGFDVGARRFSLLSLITIVVVAVTLFAGVRLANRLIGHSIGEATSLDPTQKLLAQKLVGIAVVIAAFFVGIDLLDIDLTAFTVFGGALGLAVGFGLQKTVGNLIAGIILLMDRSIKPGDVIVVGDSFGWVNKIGVRAVSVITRDGKEHLIPNENLMTQEVENWSYSDRNVRVRIAVGVSYSSDIELAQALMMRAAEESPRVLNSPKPTVRLTAFGENAVQHEILVWIADPESGVGSVRSDVLNRLWRLFKEHDVGLPFPQRDIHVRSLPAMGGSA